VVVVDEKMNDFNCLEGWAPYALTHWFDWIF
jgi:hypothetical protein